MSTDTGDNTSVNHEGTDTPLSDEKKILLQYMEEHAETAARREAALRNELNDLRRRVLELHDRNTENPASPRRFGPFGMFQEDPNDGTYRLALPLLIAICGAIFGMLITLV